MIDAAVVLAVLRRDPVHDPLWRSHVELLPELEGNASPPGRMTSLSEGVEEGSHPSDRRALITKAVPFLEQGREKHHIPSDGRRTRRLRYPKRR